MLSGKHVVSLGSSMRDEPSTSYHGIRLNFQPGTMDQTRPASLTGGLPSSSSGNNSSGTAGGGEYSMTVPSREGAAHVFKGSQVPAKDVDCLLIWNEERGEYVLERLDSVLRLDHQRNSGAQHSKRESSGVNRLDTAETPQHSRHKAKTSVATSDDRTQSSKSSKTRDQEDEKMVETPTRSQQLSKSVQHDKVEDDEDDLDDLADMLESTLDESRSTKPIATPLTVSDALRSSVPRSRDDESSEEED